MISNVNPIILGMLATILLMVLAIMVEFIIRTRTKEPDRCETCRQFEGWNGKTGYCHKKDDFVDGRLSGGLCWEKRRGR